MSDGRRLARASKRLFDIGAASVLLLLLAPVIAVLVLLIRWHSPGPAIFRQQRAGMRGRPFTMYKLRSMHIDAEERLDAVLAASPALAEHWARHGWLPDDPRLLPGLGPFVRRNSLDELPQLFNVLRGDMSLVGPRPLELAVRARLPGEMLAVRESVPAGVTGLWQVSGRNEIDLDGLLSLDDRYVASWSMRSDLMILARTPWAVLSRRGAV